MPPRRPATTRGRDDDDDDDNLLSEHAELSELLSGLPTEVKAQVSRIDPVTRRPSILGRVEIAALGDDPVEWTARNYGEGEYSLSFYEQKSSKNPSGYIKGVKQSFTVDRDHPGCDERRRRIGKVDVRSSSDTISGADAYQAMVGGGVGDLIRASADALRASREGGGDREGKNELLTLMFESQRRSDEKMANMMMAMSDSQTKLLTVLLPLLVGGRGEGGGISEKVLDLVLKNAIGGNAPTSSMKETIETLSALEGFRKQLTPGSDEGDDEGNENNNLYGLAREGLSLFGKFVEAGGVKRTAPQIQANPATATVVSEPDQHQPAITDGGEAEMESQLRAAVKGWLEAAAAGRDPGREAAVTWGQISVLPKAWKDRVVAYLGKTVTGAVNGEFVLESDIVKWEPTVAEHDEWFKDFFFELRVCAGVLEDEPDEDDEEEVGDDDRDEPGESR